MTPSLGFQQLQLPPHVLETLAAAGVVTLSDWKRLGQKRRQIFGITSATRKKIDQAAREARQ